MSPELRSAISNGIWLCQTCAKLIDNDVKGYPLESLIIWKRRHEEFVKRQLLTTSLSAELTRPPGLLVISEIYTNYPEDGLSCILDIRVSNHGGSDVIINAVELRVLESLRKAYLGQGQYSATYDLDIKSLTEYQKSMECRVAQILVPGEADRFAIVLSYSDTSASAGWRLSTLFKSNFGDIAGPDIEVWLPHPEKMRSFLEVKNALISAANSQIFRDARGKLQGGKLENESGKNAGWRTYLIVGLAIVYYFGPQPLIEK